MADDTIKFEIGFRGGGHITGQVGAAEWAKVEAALEKGSGTFSFEHDEHRWWLRADDVTFSARVDRDRRRGAGFAN